MNRISKDDIRTLVVVIAVCVICVTLVIVLNIKSNSDKLEPVKEYNTFFPITNYVNTYINYICFSMFHSFTQLCCCFTASLFQFTKTLKH